MLAENQNNLNFIAVKPLGFCLGRCEGLEVKTHHFEFWPVIGEINWA